MALVPIAISPPLPTVTGPVQCMSGIEDQLGLVLEPLGLGQFEAVADADVATEDIQLADHAAGVDHAGIEQPHGGLAVAGERGAGVKPAAL